MTLNEYTAAFLTQSKNSSAKMALVVDEFSSRNYDVAMNRKSKNWDMLPNFVISSSNDAFRFLENSFYFRMFDKLIHDFIPTGIMNHLVEKHFIKSWKYEKIEYEPYILSIEDLAFGFNIWLCFCLISIIAFIAEHIYAKQSINNKIYPINNTDEDKVCIDQISTYEILNGISPELVEKFRVKKQTQPDVENIKIVSNEIEIIDLENAFGDIVDNLQNLKQ